MKPSRRMLLNCVTLLSIFWLAGAAHAAETGWEYSRDVDDFDDSVGHTASNWYTENGETFSVGIVCDKNKELNVGFIPGQYVHLRRNVSVDVRVDKKPTQSFTALWHETIAWVTTSLSASVEPEKIHRLTRDLIHGTQMIFRVGSSSTATLSLNGSVKPISKVLEACNVPLHD